MFLHSGRKLNGVSRIRLGGVVPRNGDVNRFIAVCGDDDVGFRGRSKAVALNLEADVFLLGCGVGNGALVGCCVHAYRVVDFNRFRAGEVDLRPGDLG